MTLLGWGKVGAIKLNQMRKSWAVARVGAAGTCVLLSTSTVAAVAVAAGVAAVVLTSLMLISASTYWSPFWRMEMSAAGGTSVPLMLDWLMWLSIPKVKAEWEKPESRKRKP